MCGIDVFVVFVVTAFHFVVVMRCVSMNELVLRPLKCFVNSNCCLFGTIYRNGHLCKMLYYMYCELGRTVGVVFFERF